MNIAKIESLAKSIVPTLKTFVETQGQLIEEGIRKDFDERHDRLINEVSELKSAVDGLDLIDAKRVEVLSRKVFDEEIEQFEFDMPVEDINKAEQFVADYFDSLRECLDG